MRPGDSRRSIRGISQEQSWRLSGITRPTKGRWGRPRGKNSSNLRRAATCSRTTWFGPKAWTIGSRRLTKRACSRTAAPRKRCQRGRNPPIRSRNPRPDTDVDLRIFRGNDANPFAFDNDLPQQNRNCRVEFVAPANDSYRVVVVNLGKGMANRCDVAIDVR